MTMLTPYVMASRTPLRLSPDRFRKKLTVMGIIGHTQGVSNATSPPRNPKRKIFHHACWAALEAASPKAASSSTTGVQ